MTELEQNPGKSGNFVIAVPIDDETSPLAPDVSSPAAKTRLKGSGKRRPAPGFGLVFFSIFCYYSESAHSSSSPFPDF